MTMQDFFRLMRLLLKYRSLFSMSHKQRDLIDNLILDCLDHAYPMAVDMPSDELPF